MASIGAGLIMLARGDRWWRCFGQPHLGWEMVDPGVITVTQTLQKRRMAQADPLDPAVLEHERKKLRVILGANATADVAYVVAGYGPVETPAR